MNAITRIESTDPIIQVVLDSVDSEHTRRAYERALRDFFDWYDEAGRPTLNKATVQRYAAGLREQGVGASSTVGCFPSGASPYGAEDLSGNVWEWCHSLYSSYPYNSEDGREDPEAKDRRMLRGGAFLNNERGVRCACRIWLDPYRRISNFGFRLVVAPGF